LTTLFGGPFSTLAKRVAVWNKAAPIPGCDKAIWRCDDQGRIIRWADYGDRFSRYGWGVVQSPAPGLLGQAFGVTEARPAHVDKTATSTLRRAA
jgi:hypothetical protein